MARLLAPLPCLIWDVDGTLVDTTTLIVAALDHIYRTYFDREMPLDARRALIGIPLRKQIRVFGEPSAFGHDEAEVTGAFIRYYETHRSEERILDEVIALVVEGHRRGLPVALVTSKNREERANTLPRLGIADCIDFAVTADDVVHPKPDPEGIRQALSSLAIPPEHHSAAVYIGDTVHDMQAAHAAGVQPIAVTWGAAPRPLLEAQSPIALCDTSEELRQLLFPA